MVGRIRRVGIDLIGEVPWGTHLCLFYETQAQLVEMLRSYFLAGVEDNEYCVWMVAAPLTVETAAKVLRKEMRQLSPYLKRGQVEILDRRPWQRDDGKVDAEAMFQGWAEMERQAIRKGFDGLRICGDMGWVEDEDWEAINHYEELVDGNTDQEKLLAFCAYSQEKCGISKVYDLIANHQFSLIRRAGNWEAVTSSGYGRMQEALQASEDRYQALVRSSLHHMFMLSREGTYLESNDLVEQFGLKSGNALIGLSLDDIYPPEIAEAYAQQLERVLATGLSVEFEHPMLTLGEDHEYLVTLYPIYRFGEIEAIGGVSRDITETTRAEKAVRQAEERYHSIYQNALEGIFQSTPDGRYLHVNPAMARIFGYASPEEMISSIGNDIENRIHVDPARRADFINALLADGLVKEFENQNFRKDGSIIWTRTNARVVYDSKGAPLYFEGFLTDITDRKRFEEALRASEVRFRTLASVASAGIYLTDAQGMCQYVNPRWCQMAGLGLEEALGLGWGKSVHPEDRAWMLQKMHYYQGRMEEWNYEYRCLKPDGTVTWVSGASAPIVDQSGEKPDKIIGYVGVNLDITERKQMETQLRAALAEKEVLLREVHHRVKNNLAMISSLLELQARASQDAQVQSAFQESQQRIRSMTQIHEQLYRSESLSHIDMSHYVAGLADELRYIYTKGEVAVQVDVQKVRLTIDQAIPCGLIINELVTNALKYAFPAAHAPEGIPGHEMDEPHKRQVFVSLQAQDDQCKLRVIDNGVGLPRELDIQNARTLGLKLTSRLADQLGGKLVVESSLQQHGGVTFQVVFPVRK